MWTRTALGTGTSRSGALPRSPIPASGVIAPRKWRRGPRGPFRPLTEESRRSARGRAGGLRLVELCGSGWSGPRRLWSP